MSSEMITPRNYAIGKSGFREHRGNMPRGPGNNSPIKEQYYAKMIVCG